MGSYISIHRPDRKEPFGEDLIVRQVWWRLDHPETAGVVSDGSEKIGRTREIFVECDPALGPHASDEWRTLIEAARQRGIEVHKFEVSRFSVGESDLQRKD
jgi:hypothetical protein